MTTFDKREEGFEAKFAHDEELRFLTLARRNKLLGAWAAGLMGLSEAQAAAYATQLAAPDLIASDERLAIKVVADLKAKGIARQPQEVLATMKNLLARAIGDIEAGH
jgi:hypothetical protein